MSNASKSKTSKTAAGVGALAVIIVGIWFAGLPKNVLPAANNAQTPKNTQPVTSAQSGASNTTNTSATKVTTVTTTSPTPANDTSDTAITQDAANIDGQMNALNADNSAADSGISNPSQ